MVLQIMHPWEERTIWNYIPFAVSALLVWRAMKNSQANNINEADRLSKQKLREELVDTKIAEYKAQHAPDITEA